MSPLAPVSFWKLRNIPTQYLWVASVMLIMYEHRFADLRRNCSLDYLCSGSRVPGMSGRKLLAPNILEAVPPAWPRGIGSSPHRYGTIPDYSRRQKCRASKRVHDKTAGVWALASLGASIAFTAKRYTRRSRCDVDAR